MTDSPPSEHDWSLLWMRLRLWAFPLALLFVVLLMTALDLNGSSVSVIDPGPDSGLVAGDPRPIRSDEWRVRTPLIVRQAATGWNQHVDIAAGSHDIGIVADVPVRDWATFVRPHHWGYWMFGLSRGFAFEWWLNWAVAAAGTYALLVVITRRIVLSASLGAVVAAAPSVQWWTNSFTGCVIGYTCAALAGLIVALREPHRSWRWFALVAASAWLFACAGTIPYPAWVVPLFVGLAPLAVLAIWVESGEHRVSPAQRVSTVAAVGFGAAVMAGAFFLHHRSALSAISSTVYPGRRSESGGGGDLVGLFGSPYYWYVARRAEPVLVNGTNESEAAGPLMLLLPALVAYTCVAMVGMRGALRRHAAAALAGGMILLAWFLLPIPASLGRIALLDQVPPDRLLHTLGPIGAIGFGVTLALVASSAAAARRRIAASSAVAMFVATAVAGTSFRINDAPLPDARIIAVALAVALAVGVALAGYLRSGAVALAVIALSATVLTNPLQRGLGPLAGSPALAAINAEASSSPDVWWVSTSDAPADIALFTASSAPMVSGPSVYPNVDVWTRIDPDRSEAAAWNSFSHIMVDALDEGSVTTMAREADILHLGLDLCGPDAAALGIGRVAVPATDWVPACATDVEVLEGPSGPLLVATVRP
jgi:hypothetical protein